jgi:hypothetical protein
LTTRTRIAPTTLSTPTELWWSRGGWNGGRQRSGGGREAAVGPSREPPRGATCSLGA